MKDIAVIGAGAFGTSLAMAQAAAGRSVIIWGRDASVMDTARTDRILPRLPGIELGPFVCPTGDLEKTDDVPILLLALPAQTLGEFLRVNSQRLAGRTLVACSKGIDLTTGLGPWSLIRQMIPDAQAAVLTGPSFAADIARGLPTALTLASEIEDLKRVQEQISTPTLRLYRSDDPRGAELGGALKNVVAIAAGLAIGAGFGESARAAVVARGFAEISRLAGAMGANPETLFGLSGIGDLVLTATSTKSRNFSYGIALGQESVGQTGATVEGVATARAVIPLAQKFDLQAPLAKSVLDVIEGHLSPAEAAESLLSRPLKDE